jgi:hypothetical protein
MSGDQGRAAVVADAVTGVAAGIAAADRAAADAQMPMFEVPTRFHGPRADAVRAAVERRSGPGRPPGAVNKSTKAMREYLLARGVNPLVALARYALMPPDLLAQELGCSVIEAFREWRSLQEALAPYLFGKAVPIDDEGKPVPFLQMNVGGVLVAPGGDREPPWVTALREMQQNQGFLEPPKDVSHADMSHGVAK